MSPSPLGWVLTGAAYVVYLALVIVGLYQARAMILAEYGTPEAIEQWREWQLETERQSKRPEGSERRAVGIDEPPQVVLMRDRFGLIALGTVLTASFMFAFLVFIVRGMLQPSAINTTATDET
ncbi:MAG: hypothetical protein JSS27_20850 [Planctomycetes bacterium]|nr:hypothetical protein [Planctomycetota bacterium]